MQAGCHAVKLEGAAGNLDIITFLIQSGIPVMGHLGLTPQSVNTLGGFKLQGKQLDAAIKIKEDAIALEKAGCFSLVLECVPTTLAKEISEALRIPTIGIGAGPHTDGQVLVLQDMLGMSKTFRPKFVKQYLEGHDLIKKALNEYHNEVKSRTFPDIKKHSFQ
jgi:3-methyl-2-oxobutanoate hydroxymethyltransferase